MDLEQPSNEQDNATTSAAVPTTSNPAADRPTLSHTCIFEGMFLRCTYNGLQPVLGRPTTPEEVTEVSGNPFVIRDANGGANSRFILFLLTHLTFSENGSAIKIDPRALRQFVMFYAAAHKIEQPETETETITRLMPDITLLCKTVGKRIKMANTRTKCKSKYHQVNIDPPIDPRSHYKMPICTNCYNTTLHWQRSVWPTLCSLRMRTDINVANAINAVLDKPGLKNYLYAVLIRPTASDAVLKTQRVDQFVLRLLYHDEYVEKWTWPHITLEALGIITGQQLQATRTYYNSPSINLIILNSGKLLKQGYAEYSTPGIRKLKTSRMVAAASSIIEHPNCPVYFMRSVSGNDYLVSHQYVHLIYTISGRQVTVYDQTIPPCENAIGPCEDIPVADLTARLQNISRVVPVVLYGDFDACLEPDFDQNLGLLYIAAIADHEDAPAMQIHGTALCEIGMGLVRLFSVARRMDNVAFQSASIRTAPPASKRAKTCAEPTELGASVQITPAVEDNPECETVQTSTA
jgi:hypothetical protein